MKKLALYLSTITCTIVLSILTACAPNYNIRKTDQSSVSPPAPNIHQDDQALIFVAFSGGGTRAAAMSWKALETFKQIPYTYTDANGREVVSTLANEIDYISGISGGSFAAAAWCLYRDNMDVFREGFIERDIQGDLLRSLFIPWKGLRLLSPTYDRINMASELYDEEVFYQKTFGDLPPHPVLWINATHLALGTRFTFTQDYFDLLDSDLSQYPIGYASAASSAFPILLSPITVMNYGESVDLMEDIKYKMAKRNARRNVEKAFYASMREFYNDKTNKYMHLADGGLVDNQGLQVIVDQFDTNGIINKKLNDRERPLKRLIIINVNAGVSPEDNSCREQNAPHVDSVIEYTMVTSMDILSAKRWIKIKERSKQVYKPAIDIGETTRSLSQLEKPYTIEISFRNIKDEALREKSNNLPTSFYLTEEQIDLIDGVVPVLIEEDPDMKRLKRALNH
jgi:NTE family protein